MAYYTRFVKAALATFTHMGCLLDGELGGTVSIAATGEPLAGVNVQARLNDVPRRRFRQQPNGTYQHLLQAGSYTVVFSAPDYRTETVNNVQIVAGEQTTLDRSLQPCETVKQVSFSAAPEHVSGG